jgi:hypothetical protein
MMRPAQKLEPAERPVLEEILDVQELTGVDDRLHHHVVLARLPHGRDDRPAFLERRGHRHRAGHMFARPKRGDGLLRVIRNRGVDVHRVDVRILEHRGEVRVAAGDAETVGCLVERGLGPLAYGDEFGVRMGLVDRHELRPEPESCDGHPYWLRHR